MTDQELTDAKEMMTTKTMGAVIKQLLDNELGHCYSTRPTTNTTQPTK